MAEAQVELQMLETSLWRNRRCLAVCTIVAISNMQYGLDTSSVGALQAMPGFLKIFGYEDPNAPGGFGIDVSFGLSHFLLL